MGEIPMDDDGPVESGLPPCLSASAAPAAPAASRSPASSPTAEVLPTLRSFLRGQEQWYIGHVLAAVRGDKVRAAAILDVSLATFYRKVDPSQKAPRRPRCAAS